MFVFLNLSLRSKGRKISSFVSFVLFFCPSSEASVFDTLSGCFKYSTKVRNIYVFSKNKRTLLHHCAPYYATSSTTYLCAPSSFRNVVPLHCDWAKSHAIWPEIDIRMTLADHTHENQKPLAWPTRATCRGSNERINPISHRSQRFCVGPQTPKQPWSTTVYHPK